MKKLFSLFLAVALVGCILSFAGAALAADKIGVSMPTQSLQRWNQDGANMKSLLEAAGYEVDLQFGGNNEVPVQVSQLENMISGGCKVLVVAAIDGSSLTTVLADAKAQGIQVIAYDRLIMNTDAVSYYATFDNFRVGVLQGTFIRDQLKLDSASGPFNIELFTGDPGDNNIIFFFDGALSILKPYIDSGKLVVKSGQVERAQAATPNWSTESAQTRMENLITSQGYGPNGTKLDAVLSSNDSVANGITNALVGAGYTAANFPLLTGQDCDVTSMKNILAGTQSMSIFKDTRTLAAQVVTMVDAIMKGSAPEINDTKTYDNGTGVIPSFLCEPVFCTKDNYRALLIDSGYYTEAQLTQ
ncbi:MAG: sugar-binding protein [Synergistaceae bacterium]|jgi:putative multiple sugar transport system substrate-binding protein|nr:sugar-binding protein [Synergistaceae bacterium]